MHKYCLTEICVRECFICKVLVLSCNSIHGNICLDGRLGSEDFLSETFVSSLNNNAAGKLYGARDGVFASESLEGGDGTTYFERLYTH